LQNIVKRYFLNKYLFKKLKVFFKVNILNLKMTSNIKRISIKIVLLALSSVYFSSCASIIGGSKYTARVSVKDHPYATINYNGAARGNGNADFEVKRKETNMVVFSITEPNCEEQKFTYSKRVLRGWALFGTIVGWTSTAPIPIPFGVIVDVATGALWKPDVREKGVMKDDYDHFNYSIDYTGCKQVNSLISNTPVDTIPKVVKTKLEKLTELTKLQNKGLLTEEEYETEKKKILDSE
jgi:hypothetical protein